MISATVFCLSMAIYYEARSEPLVGQIAVAQVIMNNVNWKQDKVCKKVYQPGFLSSLNEQRVVPAEENEAWKMANKAAKHTLKWGKEYDLTGGADHFDMVNANPRWKKHCNVTLILQGHFFCKERI